MTVVQTKKKYCNSIRKLLFIKRTGFQNIVGNILKLTKLGYV